MSNIDNMTTIEQLFTELTPEEGAVIEGGVTFELLGIDVIKRKKQNDLYVNFNGTRMFGIKNNVKTGYDDETNNPVSFDYRGRLEIWDADRGIFSSKDDRLGSWSISNEPGTYSETAKGKGYEYRLDFRIS